MKHVIKKGIITGVLLTTMLSNAHEGSSFIPKKEKDITKTVVTINDVKEGQELIIKDDSGLVLYKEAIKVSGLYNKAFDLTELPDGDYFFEIDKDMEIQSIPFNVTSNKVVFNKEKETTIYKPYIRIKDRYVYLTKLALNKEPLAVNLFYGDELIYSETISNTKTIEKVYKLMKSNTGNYKIELKSNGRTYYKYFQL